MLRRKFCKILSSSLICLLFGFSLIKVNAENSDNTGVNVNIETNVDSGPIYNSVNDFVVKSYEVFLNRNNLDDTGIEYWSYLLGNHNESLYNYMISLVTGEEFLSKDVSDKEFIDMIYKLLFNKSPRDEESNYWIGKIEEENEKLNDKNSARHEVSKMMFGENSFREFSYKIGTTPEFQNLNNFGVAELREEYDSEKIEYINGLYEEFTKVEQAVLAQSEDSNRDIETILGMFPIFANKTEDKMYEDIKSVSSGNIKRIVHALDYQVELPNDTPKSVYISPFIELDGDKNNDFITLGLSVTSRNLGKLITKADIVLGNESLDLEVSYKDQSKYDEKGISVHEFKIKINSKEDLELLNKILSYDLSKLRFTFDDSSTYVYSLYEKDRVRNTLRFMNNLYTHIVVTALI